MQRLAIGLVLLAACAVDAPDEVDFTLATGGKADALDERVSFGVDGTSSWFADHADPYALTVKLRGTSALALKGPLVSFDMQSADGAVNFTPQSSLTITLESTPGEAELGFVLFDHARYLARGEVVPYRCPHMDGQASVFRTLAIDFTKEQLSIDGAPTISFASCGIKLDTFELDPTKFALASLAVPVIEAGDDKAPLVGTHHYRFSVAVR